MPEPKPTAVLPVLSHPIRVTGYNLGEKDEYYFFSQWVYDDKGRTTDHMHTFFTLDEGGKAARIEGVRSTASGTVIQMEDPF